jgi:hypothetical protein
MATWPTVEHDGAGERAVGLDEGGEAEVRAAAVDRFDGGGAVLGAQRERAAPAAERLGQEVELHGLAGAEDRG